MTKKNRILTALTALALCVMLAAAAFPQYARAAEDKMTVYAIDLRANNTGEATMVVAGNGSSLLIDTGDLKTDALLTWLSERGYKKGGTRRFDLLISHWHTDHAARAAQLIREYNVGKVYLPTRDPGNTQYDDEIRRAAKSAGKTIVVIKGRGQEIRVGTNVKGRVLLANEALGGDKSTRENNRSIAIMFTGGGSRFLTCGDIYKEAENRILSNGDDVRADIMKMDHHGYPNANSAAFLRAVSPSYAWFTTCFATRRTFIPDKVKESAEAADSITNLFSTRYNGTVCFVSRNGNITVSAEANTAVLYRRVKNRRTGNEATRKFTVNNKGVPKITDKIIDSSKYEHWQVNADGSAFTGKWEEDGSRCMLVDSSGICAVDTAAVKDGKYYWFDRDGTRKGGWRVIGGRKYYFAPAMSEGFVKLKKNGIVRTYYFMNPKCGDCTESSRGALTAGFRTINGKRYYLTDEGLAGYRKEDYGVRLEDRWAEIDGGIYLMDTNGVIKTGLTTVDSGGGTASGSGEKYYFELTGKMRTGFLAISGGTYYFRPGTGKVSVNRNTGPAGGVGQMLFGKQNIGGRYYYFNDTTGKMYADKTATINGTVYTFDKDGVITSEKRAGKAAAPLQGAQNASEEGSAVDEEAESKNTVEPAVDEPEIAAEEDADTVNPKEEEAGKKQEEDADTPDAGKEEADIPGTGGEDAEAPGTGKTSVSADAEAEQEMQDRQELPVEQPPDTGQDIQNGAAGPAGAAESTQ